MIVFNFYSIFFSSFVSSLSWFFFYLIEEFFAEILNVFQLENLYVEAFVMVLSIFLTNPIFKKLFKKRIREACLINFMTYRLNFEISRFK
ncbi:hypothetical protein F907_02541 [Acinetobacter colistiniresistens]|uniref:Uncharacterized protein n=2 Tax=Acinetobacter colistiniresistens TaxID=280145 RepID=S3TB04_9GAMM|nr:hypothetical protein [Acinetobacter colistiniresistens]EPG36844.1 hypothetical protein F907_02541 [Acinetobacter colistiniresistens]